MHRLIWLVPIVVFLIAAAILVVLGFSTGAAILITFLFASPMIIIWAVAKLFDRRVRSLREPAPHTHGLLIEWVAPFYDWYCPKIGLGRGFRRRTIDYAGIKPGEHILDVGCGTGVLTRLATEAAGPNGRGVGIDPGPKMLAVAKENAVLEKSRAEFRLAAIEALPFGDNSFDCVLSSFMVHHLTSELKQKGFGEVYRVLKPGGRVLVVDIGRPTNPAWWLVFWPLIFWPFTRELLEGRLGERFLQAGFSKVEVLGHWGGCCTFWMARKPLFRA